MAKTSLFSFTPSLMTGATLEAIFVQREALAADLVERIRESALTASKHHTLVIGPRGMGKTHLVALVYHRLQAMPDLQERLLVAWLREEEWGVTTFLDLLLRILRALAEEDAAIVAQMDALYELDAGEAERTAANLLNHIIGKRTLLLIAENLDDLFGGLGEAGQQSLRAFLQNYSNCTILATSPRLFNGIQKRSAPFYGFFRPVHLGELTAPEAQQLLVNIAKLQQQDDLVEFLNTPTGKTRIQAVQHLAGGNPRIYIIFADFLTHQALDELVSPFLELVDLLTPYYQSRMQFLSAQQRKIVEFLCEKKHPVPVKLIAQRCFVSQQVASSQLKELKDKGYVQAEAIGRESFYDIAEPLMRICLGVKKERGEPLRLMVDFLRVWYPKDELQAMRESLLVVADSGICRYLDRALDDSDIVDEDPRIQACLDEIQSCFDREDYSGALKTAEKLLQIRDSWVERERYAACLAYLGRDEEALINDEKALELNPNYAKAWYGRGVDLFELGRHEEALASYDKAIEIKPDYYNAWNNRGVCLFVQGLYKEALASLDKALEIKPEYWNSWLGRGFILYYLHHYEEAITSFDKALALNSNNDLVKNLRAQAVTELNRKNNETFIEQAILSLLTTISNPDQWPAEIPQLLDQFSQRQELPLLAAALVKTSRELISELVSSAKATAWRDAWAEAAGNIPEMQLPLRLLSTVLNYKTNPDDPRVWLALPVEEQKILRQALGLEEMG